MISVFTGDRSFLSVVQQNRVMLGHLVNINVVGLYRSTLDIFAMSSERHTTKKNEARHLIKVFSLFLGLLKIFVLTGKLPFGIKAR